MESANLAGLAQRSFRHRYPPYAVQFGADAFEQAGRLLVESGRTGCLLTTGASLGADAGAIETIRAALEPLRVVHFAGTKQHCPVDTVRDAYDLLREEGLDAILAVGGGSTSDHAKAVALLAATGLDLDELVSGEQHYARFGRIGERPALFCAPTTFSGAEVTFGGAMTTADPPRKFIFTSEDLFPDLLVLDPRVYLKTPRDVLVASGMNALNHAVSRYMSDLSQPLVESQFVYAFGALYDQLPLVRHASGAEWEDAVSMCMLASHLSQSTNVLGGFTHACCHVLGAWIGAPHGVLNGIMLPRVVEALDGRPAERAAALARTAGVGDLAPALDRLLERLELPQRLHEVGVEEKQLDPIADEIVGDFSYAQSGGIDWSQRVRGVLAAAY